MRPSIGFAAIALLEAAGCRVEVPLDQTCCGQPALNSGDREGAHAASPNCTIALLEPFEHVAVPSGSWRRHHHSLITESCLTTIRPGMPARTLWPGARTSCSVISWTCGDGCPNGCHCPPPRRTTIVAPACASLASKPSHVGSLLASTVCR